MKSASPPNKGGQAMVEYALILALLAISMAVVLWATGPAIGNVFCNVVYNISGENANLCGGTDIVLADEGGRSALFWETVTWVAANRQGETPFPTPQLRPPIQQGPELRTYTYTPTFTPSPTITPSATFTATETFIPGTTPTPSDLTFNVPHVDQMNKPEWWRIDRYTAPLLFGDAGWNVTWYNEITPTTPTKANFGVSNESGTSTLAASMSLNYPSSSSAPAGAVGLASPPAPANPADRFGARFTRTITLPASTAILFSLRTDDFGRLFVDSTKHLEINNGDSTRTVTLTLGAGTHTIEVLWAENTGNAQLVFSMTPLNANNPDNAGTCAWGGQNVDADSASRTFVMDENPATNSWTANSTCNLELRGRINLTGVTNPTLSFWDYWDFIGNAGASAKVQIGNYVPSGSGVDRGQFAWCDINLHAANTANYNWTRSRIDIRSQCPSLGDSITLRFVASSTTAGTLRWRIDDIQVLDEPNSNAGFTLGEYWNLNNRSQMNDFIFTADSDYAVSDLYPSLPQNPSTARRWNLTANGAREGTAWDDSPGGNYQIPGTNDAAETGTNSPYRIHYLEFRQEIDLTTARISGLTTDYEGDTGAPILSFWLAYDVPVGASIRVQYTRAGRNRTGTMSAQNPDSWTDVNGGVLVNFSAPAGTPALNEQVARENLAMQLFEIPISTIPDVATQPFRLRIALYMTSDFPIGSGTDSVAGDGMYVDDIRIERQSTVAYTAYPFVDEAEDSVFLDANWLINGTTPRWGQVSSPRFGALGTANSYADSPIGNYAQNTSTSLQLKKLIDLLNDTPENDADGASDPAAIDPLLTFYFVRQVGNNIQLAVDLFSPVTNTWTQVWNYASASDTTFRDQRTWERAEISLSQALQNATGIAWSTISSDANLYNDDFRIRFRLDTGGSSTADGVFIDQIEIKDAPGVTHRLWSTATTTANGTGGGTLVDSIDFVDPLIVPGTFDQRWYRGTWEQTSASGFVRTGSLAIADSVSGNYSRNTRNIFEYLPIIDLRSTPAGSLPRMYFWTRYAINDNDNFRVEIAVENPADTAIGYDKLGGWTAWTAVNTSVTGAADVEKIDTEVNNFVREDVNLTPYIGSRVRVRFVMNVPNNSNQSDGVFIDDVTFTFGYNTVPLTFTEDAQNLSRWITEGGWGVTQQYFSGSGAEAANFGGSINWTGYYFDCENNGGACVQADGGDDVGGAMNSILNLFRHDIAAPAAIPNRIMGPETIPEINFSWGNGLPAFVAGNPAYQDDFAVRWYRRVQLDPGTYRFQTVSDDGVRLWLNDRSGTTLTAAGAAFLPSTAGYIINNWTDHSASLDYGQIVVTSATSLTDRYLYLDFYEDGGDALVWLSAARDSFSISESPNTWTGSLWNVVRAGLPTNMSLMLNGFINMSNAALNYNMSYERMWQSDSSHAFYLEVSTDGGFVWNAVGSETIGGGSQNIRPFNNWQERIVNLNAYRGNAAVTFRFRVDTRGAGSVGDGYWITNIIISN